MVELTRARGVHAVVGDAQALPFSDAQFDAVLAASMLYHLPDLDAGLAELRRVLRPGGRLVAVTNAPDHLAEIWQLTGETFELSSTAPTARPRCAGISPEPRGARCARP